jgi:hypothetical protein
LRHRHRIGGLKASEQPGLRTRHRRLNPTRSKTALYNTPHTRLSKPTTGGKSLTRRRGPAGCGRSDLTTERSGTTDTLRRTTRENPLKKTDADRAFLQLFAKRLEDKIHHLALS